MKPISVCLLLFCLILGCKQNAQNEPKTSNKLVYSQVVGKTMGTVYTVKYEGKQNLKPQIDSLLEAINASVSTYIPNSTISIVNKATASETPIPTDKHFDTNFQQASLISAQSGGAYNVHVMPLVNYYGFGFEKVNLKAIDTAQVLALQQLTKPSCFSWTQGRIKKLCNGAMVDFSSIAKGYGVDQVAQLIEQQGITNYLVDIGGETFAKGISDKQKPWTVGIRKPSPDPASRTSAIKAIPINNKAMATSGNYENYKALEDGQTIAHTINPLTGFPQALNHEVLSSTVIAPNCMIADAYATTLKVLGLEKGIALAEKVDNVEAFLVYADENGKLQWKATSGMLQD